MRRTKKIDNNSMEVIRKDGTYHTVHPNHEWWHIFLRLTQLEEKEEPKVMIVPNDDMEPYRCPNCGTDLGFTDDYFGDVTDIQRNGRYCQKCGQKLC